jgi:DNA helicase-2/ATP-dependent DNA helicase PcrA
MADLIAMRECMDLPAFAEYLIKSIEYDKYLSDNKRPDFEDRMDIINELIGDIKEKAEGVPEDTDQLSAYLENIALVTDIDSMEEGSGAVSLMTLHSAKGLEFSVVFIAGMEEDIFPSSRAKMETTQMEEERRLCYVGITRAKEKLYLVNAQQRSLFGDYKINRPSQFLDEIPTDLLDRSEASEARQEYMRNTESRFTQRTVPAERTMHAGFGSVPSTAAGNITDRVYKPYQKVRHEKFGEGTVTEVSGAGSSQLVTIDFFSYGIKKFAAAYAPITLLEDQ